MIVMGTLRHKFETRKHLGIRGRISIRVISKYQPAKRDMDYLCVGGWLYLG